MRLFLVVIGFAALFHSTYSKNNNDSTCPNTAEGPRSSEEITGIALSDPIAGFKLLRKKHEKLKTDLDDEKTKYELMKATCIVHVVGAVLEEFASYYSTFKYPGIDKDCPDMRRYPDYKTQDQYIRCEAFLNCKVPSARQGGDKLRNDTSHYLNDNGISVHDFCYSVWRIDQIRHGVMHVLKMVDDMLKKYDIPISRMKAPPFTRGNLTLLKGDDSLLNALVRFLTLNRGEFRLQRDSKNGGFMMETDEC